jgi:hypothetical protein
METEKIVGDDRELTADEPVAENQESVSPAELSPQELNGSGEEQPETPVAEETAAESVQEEMAAKEETLPEHPAAESSDDNMSYLNTQMEKLIVLKEEKNFSDFWFYVRELNKMIFTVRGVAKADRLKFKERIGEICDEAKKLQDEWKSKISKTSLLKLERIRQMIDEAMAFGHTHDELEKSFHQIEEANKFFREGKVTSDDGEESAEMSREDREQAKEALKAGKEKILDRKRAIREGNFKTVTQRLTTISDQLVGAGKPQKIFDAIKKLRIEMKGMILDRPQLREIDTVIETIWKKAREKSSIGREHDTRKRIDGLVDLLKRKEKFIQVLEQEIKELGIKWDNVKNDFFKNRVNEWMEEKKQKIESTKKEITGVEEKINFLREQMKRNGPR